MRDVKPLFMTLNTPPYANCEATLANMLNVLVAFKIGSTLPNTENAAKPPITAGASAWNTGIEALIVGTASLIKPLNVLKPARIPPRTSPKNDAMFTLPIASSVPASPRVIALFMFAICVSMPPAAVCACSLKLVIPEPPSRSSRIIASINWSIETVPQTSPPSFCLPPPRAAYKSRALCVGPRRACASCVNCPGIACISDFQSCISGLPLDKICLNCSIAADANCWFAPEAMSISFKPRPTLVARSRSFVMTASPLTV